MISINFSGSLRPLAGCGLLLFVLGGCSGSSGSGTPPSDPAQAPTLTLDTADVVLSAGGSTTLHWNSAHAERCEASGGWSGTRATSGTERIGPVDSVTDFRLTCSGAGGSIARQVQIRVSNGGASVDLRAEATEIESGGVTTLIWTSENANECRASGGWTGEQPLSGRYTAGPLHEPTTFQLACSGPDGNAITAVNVELFDRMIRWVAPTQNVDGSPLTDLVAFEIHWGTRSGHYSDSHRIDSAVATEWEADLAPGSYYFALTAIDADGEVSAFSNEMQKTLP